MIKVSLCSWDRRPAVLFTSDAGPFRALALLRPGANWTEVDAGDVWFTSVAVDTEEEFRAKFEGRFGKFALPKEALDAMVRSE